MKAKRKRSTTTSFIWLFLFLVSSTSTDDHRPCLFVCFPNEKRKENDNQLILTTTTTTTTACSCQIYSSSRYIEEDSFVLTCKSTRNKGILFFQICHRRNHIQSLLNSSFKSTRTSFSFLCY